MRKIWVAAVLVCALVAVSLTALTQSAKPIEISFGYRPISPSLDFFVAVDKGYFEEEGLNIRTEVFRGSSDLTDALMSGKVSFATDLGMVTQLLPMTRTGEYKVLFLSLDLDAVDAPMRGPTLIVKKGAGITKIEDLKGKNIGVFPDINFKVFLEALLRKHGLDIDKDVVQTQIPPQEQMTAFASVDALFSLDPIISGIEAKHGAVVLADRVSARYIFDNFPAAASSVNAEYARKHPEVVEKVTRALSRGIEYVRQHPDQTSGTLAKWTNLPLQIAGTMQPVKYAKNDEIDIALLQKTCDYLKSLPWLKITRTLEASQLVWRRMSAVRRRVTSVMYSVSSGVRLRWRSSFFL